MFDNLLKFFDTPLTPFPNFVKVIIPSGIDQSIRGSGVGCVALGY